MDISLSKPYIPEGLKERIWEVVESGWYILGERTRRFEEKLSWFFGVRTAICVSSGTSALFLSLKALGVGEGDEVVTVSLTAFPTVEAIVHTGAKPVFVDIDQYYNLDPGGLEEVINEKTKAVIPVHLYGHPCDMDGIKEVAERCGIAVVEDACQAHGAEYRGKKVGSIGVCGCISFYPSKNLTVFGDGGAVLTDDYNLEEKVRMLRNHGRREKYTHELVGYNMRFNEIQAEIGLSQLERLEWMNERRREIAARYKEAFKDLPVKLPQERPGAKHVYHLFVIEFEKRDELSRYLKEKGISTGIHYPIPCHMQPGLVDVLGRQPSLPRTEDACKRILSLPIYPTMTQEEQDYVIEAVRSFFK